LATTGSLCRMETISGFKTLWHNRIRPLRITRVSHLVLSRTKLSPREIRLSLSVLRQALMRLNLLTKLKVECRQEQQPNSWLVEKRKQALAQMQPRYLLKALVVRARIRMPQFQQGIMLGKCLSPQEAPRLLRLQYSHAMSLLLGRMSL